MKFNVDMSASLASQSIASLRLGVSLYASYGPMKDIHNKHKTEGVMNLSTTQNENNSRG